MAKKKLAIVLGIRPDVIRASLMLNILRENSDYDIKFIWSGQHYSDNLKDIFFRELNVKAPDIELNCGGNTDAEVVASVITKLYLELEKMQPEACVFLGDTNTVMGSIAAAQLNIPVVHIEGCMRSYYWRMPEEKYRTTIDHLSDVIYAYLDEYKQQGVAEGINPDNIVVVGNPIVDIVNKFYFERKNYFDSLATESFFSDKGLKKNEFYVMTCHRRENVHNLNSLKNIINLISTTDRKIYFPASYRTQKVLNEYNLKLPANVIMVDPIGYFELLVLLTNSRGTITDSGTIIEETCTLGVPGLVIRKSSERPQVYDVGAAVKFDPAEAEKYPAETVFAKLDSIYGKKWNNPLGDGKSSERIAKDLLNRLEKGLFRRHKPQDYHIDIKRSYRDDGIKI